MPLSVAERRHDSSVARTTSIVVKPWYWQFYLRRGDAEWASDRVSDAGYASGAEAIDGFVYIGTTMYGSPTQLTVDVTEQTPPAPTSAERSLDVLLGGAGPLAVLSWGDDDPVAVVEVPVGALKMRVNWTGTDAASQHPDVEVGGNTLSPERIDIQIWSSESL